MTPTEAHKLACSLRLWAPLVQAGMSEEHGAETVLELEQHVLRLDRVSGILVDQGSWSELLQRRNRVTRAVQCLAYLMNLKHRSKLKESLVRGFRAAYRTMDKSDIDLLFVKSEALLSAADLSKQQIKVDAAYCIFLQRQRLLEDCAIYIWADSSPQAGQD